MSVSTRLVFSEVTISRQCSGQSCKKCLCSLEKGSLENWSTQREVGMPSSLLTMPHAPARAGTVQARSPSTSLTHTLATMTGLRPHHCGPLQGSIWLCWAFIHVLNSSLRLYAQESTCSPSSRRSLLRFMVSHLRSLANGVQLLPLAKCLASTAM